VSQKSFPESFSAAHRNTPVLAETRGQEVG
jgi:hypothetical protein